MEPEQAVQRVLHPGFWGWVVDNGAGISASVASISAIVAVVILVRASRDSRSRARPMVIAEFQFEPDSDTTFSLVVSNVGASVARDLTVKFDPAIPANDPDGHFADLLIKRYSRTIPTLAPSQQLRSIYATYTRKAGAAELVNKEPTPEDIKVSVKYRGLTRKQYKGTFELISDSMTLQGFSVSSSSIRGRYKTIAEESTKTRLAIEAISKKIGQPS